MKFQAERTEGEWLKIKMKYKKVGQEVETGNGGVKVK